MSRDFDPRFSTALRDELTRRADLLDADQAAEPTLPGRRQWVVVAVTAAVLLVVIGGLLTAVHRPAPPAGDGDGLVDPLTTITDPDSGSLFVGDQVDPLLHAAGTGSQRYRIAVGAGVSSVRALLSCTPGSEYRVTVAGLASRAQCARRLHAFADTPVSAGQQEVAVQVDPGTRFRLLVIPTPDGTTTYSTLRVFDPPTSLPYPAVPGAVLARKRGIGTATIAGRLSRAVGAYTVTVTCQGVGLRISTSDGSTRGPDGLCATDRLQRTSFSVGSDADLERRGRLRFSIEPVGEAYWTVTFTAAD